MSVTEFIEAPEVGFGSHANTRPIGSLCLQTQAGLEPAVLNAARSDAALLSLDQEPIDALSQIYPLEHLKCANRTLLKRENVARRIGSSQFAVLLVEGDDPLSVAPRETEARLFHEEFGIHPAQHELTFADFASLSFFLYMLDVSSKEDPRPAGVMRMIRPSPVGLKTLKILSSNRLNGEEVINPWFDDFSAKIPGFEQADKATRIRMIYDFFNVDPLTTWDVPSMAVDEHYKGHSLGATPAYGLYAAGIQTAALKGCGAIINTQDYAPLMLMQLRFARAWTDRHTPDHDGNKGKYGFTPVVYDGPEPVVPTCMPDVSAYLARLEKEKPDVYELLMDRETHKSIFQTPYDLEPELFNTTSTAA